MSASGAATGTRVVVVGGGLGGLAVALRLAAAGFAVTVCEQGSRLGGKMNLHAAGGYRFDTGPSLITMPWVFRDLFAAVGSRLDDHLELVPVHPHADYLFADGTRFAYTTSLPEWLATVRRLAPRDVEGFLRFLDLGGRLYALSRETFLRRPALAPPDRRVWRSLARAPLARGWGRYHATVAACFESPHLVQLFDRYPTYVGSSPYRAPATLAVIPYLEYAFGAWSVRGGLYRLVEALAALAAARGVELRTEARVEAISRRGGRVAGVALAGGESLPCEVVVMNGDASTLPALLGDGGAGETGGGAVPGLPPGERSLSGLVWLLAVARPMPGLAHHSVCFSADYRREFEELFAGRFPEDPTVYVSAPSRGDRSLVPPGGGEALFVMANAPADGASGSGPWGAQRLAEARRRVFSRLADSGFPDLAAAGVAGEEVWTPDRFASAYSMPGGAIYGARSHGWRRTFLRPANRQRRPAGLYLVGGSSHPGGGTPTVLLSAAITAGLVARDAERRR